MRGVKRTKLIRIKSPELMGNATHPIVQYLLEQDDDGNKLTVAPEPQVPEDVLQAFKMFGGNYCHVEYRADGTHRVLGSVPRIATLASGKVYTIDGVVTPHKVVTYKTHSGYVDSPAPDLRLLNLNASHGGAPNTYTPCNVTHTAYLNGTNQHIAYADIGLSHLNTIGANRNGDSGASRPMHVQHNANILATLTPDSLPGSVDTSFIDATVHGITSSSAIALNPHGALCADYAHLRDDNTDNNNKE